jgi:hypothetical protein
MGDRFDVILILFIFVIQQPLFIHPCYCWGKKNGSFFFKKKKKTKPKKTKLKETKLKETRKRNIKVNQTDMYLKEKM